MISAAEPSGDALAAELVHAWRQRAPGTSPRFFGAGGAKMKAAGVEILIDLPAHALIGVPTVAEFLKFRRFREALVVAARARTPDLFIGVDAFAFNGSLASRLREEASRSASAFRNWRPRLVQFVSPQVWASRPGRVRRLEAVYDLLLSILPFEPAWYAARAPAMKVVFVGHPLVDRHGGVRPAEIQESPDPVQLVLLPGSRAGELHRHLPVMLEALDRVKDLRLTPRLVLPNARTEGLARALTPTALHPAIQVGGLDQTLSIPSVALASTGTVTLECAWHGIPTVALYIASRATYAIGRRIVTVRYAAMPNLLAEGVGPEPVAGFQPPMPEFIQDAATPDHLANAVRGLVASRDRYQQTRRRLLRIAAGLGPPGASRRAAESLIEMLRTPV